MLSMQQYAEETKKGEKSVHVLTKHKKKQKIIGQIFKRTNIV